MWGTQIVEDKFKADDKGIKPCTRMGMKKPLATLFFHKHGLYDKKKKIWITSHMVSFHKFCDPMVSLIKNDNTQRWMIIA